MPLFSKKHYNLIAAAIRAQRLPGERHVACDALAEDLAALFEHDNPLFDSGRWFIACTRKPVPKKVKRKDWLG